jgi:hypothetical protein
MSLIDSLRPGDSSHDPLDLILAFWGVLQEMKYPQARPLSSESSDRDMVWGIIAQEAQAFYPKQLDQSREKIAEWLQRAMQKALLFNTLSEEIEDFKEKMLKHNIEISVGGVPACALVHLSVDVEHSGQEEKAILLAFASALSQKLAAHIEAETAH